MVSDSELLSLKSTIQSICRSRLHTLPTSVTLDDLISVAWIGALQARNSFVEGTGVPFKNFATRRINGAILDHLRSLDPLSRGERAKVKSELAVDVRTFDLDAPPPGRDDGWQIEDVRALKEVISSEDGLHLKHLFKRARLKIRTRKLLEYYFRDDLTMSEIATRIGVVESRVSQLINGAIKTLRDVANGLSGGKRKSPRWWWRNGDVHRANCLWCGDPFKFRSTQRSDGSFVHPRAYCSRVCIAEARWEGKQLIRPAARVWAIRQYVELKRPGMEISKELGVSHGVLFHMLARSGIKRRPPGRHSIEVCVIPDCGKPVYKYVHKNRGRAYGNRCHEHFREYHRVWRYQRARDLDPLIGTRKTGRKGVPGNCGKCGRWWPTSRERAACKHDLDEVNSRA